MPCPECNASNEHLTFFEEVTQKMDVTYIEDNGQHVEYIETENRREAPEYDEPSEQYALYCEKCDDLIRIGRNW